MENNKKLADMELISRVLFLLGKMRKFRLCLFTILWRDDQQKIGVVISVMH